jgi:hypothetical protein
MLVAATAILFAPPVRGGSIFDDDYAPPTCYATAQNALQLVFRQRFRSAA